MNDFGWGESMRPCAICKTPVQAWKVYCVRCLFSELRRLDPEGEYEKIKHRFDEMARKAGEAKP